jgi:di/tricarboxylate transporter
MVAVLVMVTLMLSGVLTVSESLAGFGDPVLMIMIAMFSISEALVTTGIAQKIGGAVFNAGHGNEARIIAFLILAIAGTGAFMSSTAAIAIFIPVALNISKKARISRKRLLMPLAVSTFWPLSADKTAEGISWRSCRKPSSMPGISFSFLEMTDSCPI